MTENHAGTDNGLPEDATHDQIAAAGRKTLNSLYRMRDIIAGLIALADNNSIGAGQIKNALQVAFRKMFP